uniref:DUF481 domain-containing protein n=1 Tax=Fervidobacterium nodosum TaxID=2424 RepID=A0A7C5Y613_9BACT
MKRVITISLFFMVLTVFGAFIDNPVNLIVNGNVISIGSEIYEVSPYTLKIAWQQREGVLCGELGYETDMDFSYGIVNYKLSHLNNFYGLNVKFNVLPTDKFFIKLDAGGRILLSNNVLVDFGVNDLTLIAMDSSLSGIPVFFGSVDIVPFKNFDLFLSVNNFEASKLKLSAGLGIFGFLPMNRLAVSYSPIYRLSDGQLFNIVDGTLQITLPNLGFSVSGFYNFSDTVPTDAYLKDRYGIKVSLGVNM